MAVRLRGDAILLRQGVHHGALAARHGSQRMALPACGICQEARQLGLRLRHKGRGAARYLQQLRGVRRGPVAVPVACMAGVVVHPEGGRQLLRARLRRRRRGAAAVAGQPRHLLALHGRDVPHAPAARAAQRAPHQWWRPRGGRCLRPQADRDGLRQAGKLRRRGEVRRRGATRGPRAVPQLLRTAVHGRGTGAGAGAAMRPGGGGRRQVVVHHQQVPIHHHRRAAATPASSSSSSSSAVAPPARRGPLLAAVEVVRDVQLHGSRGGGIPARHVARVHLRVVAVQILARRKRDEAVRAAGLLTQVVALAHVVDEAACVGEVLVRHAAALAHVAREVVLAHVGPQRVGVQKAHGAELARRVALQVGRQRLAGQRLQLQWELAVRLEADVAEGPAVRLLHVTQQHLVRGEGTAASGVAHAARTRCQRHELHVQRTPATPPWPTAAISGHQHPRRPLPAMPQAAALLRAREHGK
mmetsp:Transcript_42927/g.108619  ORF Transcript_42927/g.108619 Transcript_42927/m.108619 type:complete len:471 (+) Transcript_42927:498-1910(+)